MHDSRIHTLQSSLATFMKEVGHEVPRVNVYICNYFSADHSTSISKSNYESLQMKS